VFETSPGRRHAGAERKKKAPLGKFTPNGEKRENGEPRQPTLPSPNPNQTQNKHPQPHAQTPKKPTPQHPKPNPPPPPPPPPPTTPPNPPPPPTPNPPPTFLVYALQKGGSLASLNQSNIFFGFFPSQCDVKAVWLSPPFPCRLWRNIVARSIEIGHFLSPCR